MNTAKLFKNGKSQAVRLPKQFKFQGTEVYIKRIGRNVILIPKDDPANNRFSINGRCFNALYAGYQYLYLYHPGKAD
jgi:virulence-associated protein VagC